MTTEKQIALRKLSLLELASELSNVSKACKVMGYSRQQFHEIRRNFKTYGADGPNTFLFGSKTCPASKGRDSGRRHLIFPNEFCFTLGNLPANLKSTLPFPVV